MSLTSLHWAQFPRQYIFSLFAGTLILDLIVKLISHLYFHLGSISHFINLLIQPITHLVTSSIDLGFTSPYTLRTSSSIDLIWCLGLISPVGSRPGSLPLLSWAKKTSSEDCLDWRDNHPFGSRGYLGSPLWLPIPLPAILDPSHRGNYKFGDNNNI